MPERSVAHGSFVVDRTYPHPVEKVWAAWSDPKKKAGWFGDPNDPTPAAIFDFRVGGRESSSGDVHGSTYSFDVTYQDIVPNVRILYTYDMAMNGERISVSLASIEFFPAAGGTRLKVTEYGLFLDGLDTNAQREAGTNGLMDQLGAFLDKQD